MSSKERDLFERAQRGEPIDLLELEQEEGIEMVLPNRRKFRVRLFDGVHYQLYEKLQREPNDADAEKLARFAIPGLTSEELNSLSPIMGQFIMKSAARQGEAMLWNLRKNGQRPVQPPPALAEASKPQPSTREKKSSTSSRASRGHSEKQAGSGP